MEFKTCMNGHRYDPSITPECPECAMQGGHTLPLVSPTFGSPMGGYGIADDIGKTMPIGGGNTVPVNPIPSVWADPGMGTVGIGSQARVGGEATMPLMHHEDFADKATQPVAGWLVCIDGPEKGKDYRIHEENNYIGRSSQMDISIPSDTTISRENHAIIAYDVRDRMFFFAPSRGASIVRHNGRAVLSTVELKSGDRVEIGKCTFLFVPLCGENFQW